MELLKIEPLYGGSINHVFLLTTPEKKIAIKINETNRFPGMFEKEAHGLELLRKAESFKIPEVINYGVSSQHSYLLLEWLPSGNKTSDFWDSFAQCLATLHQNSSSVFGLNIDNYIGSLPQYNKSKIDNSAQFYIEKRLKPQFKIAIDQGFRFKNLNKFYHQLENEIPNEQASLIHGDLWAGNFHCTEGEIPALIDPAVAYASREMDLAMMKLFGGFPPEVFTHYDSIFALKEDWEQRIKIWQLYYLLVHLNLFGVSYLSQVNRIVDRFS